MLESGETPSEDRQCAQLRYTGAKRGVRARPDGQTDRQTQRGPCALEYYSAVKRTQAAALGRD